MKKPKIVTQKVKGNEQKVLSWYEDGERKRQTIPKPLWHLTSEPIDVEEILDEIAYYKKTRQPRQRKSNRRVKGEGSGVVQERIYVYQNKNGSTKKYIQYWFDYEVNGKKSSKYIRKAMVESIIELNNQKVPISVILKHFD